MTTIVGKTNLYNSEKKFKGDKIKIPSMTLF